MITVSEHAARRWQERKGSKASIHDNKMRVAEIALQARRIEPDKYYARGWVFVVSGNTVVTMFRPEPKHWDAIADAHAKRHPRLAEEIYKATRNESTSNKVKAVQDWTKAHGRAVSEGKGDAARKTHEVAANRGCKVSFTQGARRNVLERCY